MNAPGGKPDNPHARLPALTGLSKHSPALRKLQLLLSGRSAYEAVTEAMGGLQQLAGLQELSLQFVVSQTPKKGMWPMFFADNMQLGSLRRLAVEGSSMPPLAVSVSGSSTAMCNSLCLACRNCSSSPPAVLLQLHGARSLQPCSKHCKLLAGWHAGKIAARVAGSGLATRSTQLC